MCLLIFYKFTAFKLPVSQTVPVYPDTQLQTTDPELASQVPKLRHGLGVQLGRAVQMISVYALLRSILVIVTGIKQLAIHIC